MSIQTPDEYRAAWLKALLTERAECDAAGKTERVAAIDAELRQLGAEAQTPAKRSTKRIVKPERASV